MTHPTDNDPLLAEVLAEATPSDFREALLGEMLLLAQHRRRTRHIQRTAAGLAALALLVALVWWNLPRRSTVVIPQVARFEIVRTQSLPAAALVTTQPLPSDQIIASVGGVEMVTTATAGEKIHVINDDELLALVAPRPAALVRLGPHSAELVFVNPNDQDGFPVN